VARLADPHLCFMNVNTPDELSRARSLLARDA
jgi:molybdopterin-guanine dinucleotide biosynthesis protein A